MKFDEWVGYELQKRWGLGVRATGLLTVTAHMVLASNNTVDFSVAWRMLCTLLSTA